MKNKILLIIFALLSTVASKAQISVLSFEKDAGALDARINSVTNDNDQTCALIKIITTEKGFAFETDALGICRTEDDHTAEVWVYVAPGSRWIRLKHPQLGQSDRYEYKIPIEAACTYRMKIATGKVTTFVEEANKENYFVMTVEPKNASVKIDGKLEVNKNGVVSKMLSVGKHSYLVDCKLYHSQTGEFEILPTQKTELNLSLQPNYGYFKITSKPESGAVVVIDGEQQGETPFTTDKLVPKEYEIQLVKDMYLPATKKIVLQGNGETMNVELVMEANFAEPKVSCADNTAEIWINDEKKAVGSWTGRLSAGVYKMEARKNAHRTASQSVTLQRGNSQAIVLNAPMPICGKLNVNSDPVGADILLDGKKVGTTPEIIDKVLIGKHELKLRKAGCADVVQTVTVEEGKTVDVMPTLATGKTVTIKSTPADGTLYVDGTLLGSAPQTSTLTFGKHKLKVEKNGETKEMEIDVTENGPSNWTVELKRDCSPVTDIDGNTYKTVLIGSQCWMAENLRTTKYADGTSISLGSSTSTTKAYRYYPNNNSSNVGTYGYLYNWKAVMRNSSSSSANPSGVQGICPNGWHVPSDAEWTQLTGYVGSQSQYVCGSNNTYIAKALVSTMGWNSSSNNCAVGNNPSSNNATGFYAVPAGYYCGYYYDFGYSAYFWSATQYGSYYAYGRYLYFDYAYVRRYCDYRKVVGFSVRCLRD